MRYGNLNELLQSDRRANEYFNSLPAGVREGLLAHGEGINNLEELKHFAGIVGEAGGNP